MVLINHPYSKNPACHVLIIQKARYRKFWWTWIINSESEQSINEFIHPDEDQEDHHRICIISIWLWIWFPSNGCDRSSM